MATTRWLSLCAIGIGLSLASCGGGEGTAVAVGDGGSDGAADVLVETGPALDEIPAKLAAAFCKSVPTCLGPMFAELYLNGMSCEALYTPAFEQGALPMWRKAVEKGTMKYHPGKVEACLEALVKAGCASIQDHVYVPECEAAVEGTVAEGGECGQDVECAGDLFCKVDGACPGRCSARIASAGPCADDEDCQAGLVCFKGLCTTPLQAGMVCNGRTVDCKAPSMCIGAENGGNGICGAIQQKNQLGDACDFGSMELCAAGGVCALTGVDVVARAPKLTCVARVAADAECNLAIPSQCPLGQYCAGVSVTPPLKIKSTCAPLPGAGQACAADALFPPGCATGLFCVDKLCVAKANLDASCRYDEDCASDRCSAGKCVPDDPCLPGTPAPEE